MRQIYSTAAGDDVAGLVYMGAVALDVGETAHLIQVSAHFLTERM